jgi:hypothetical protein
MNVLSSTPRSAPESRSWLPYGEMPAQVGGELDASKPTVSRVCPVVAFAPVSDVPGEPTTGHALQPGQLEDRDEGEGQQTERDDADRNSSARRLEPLTDGNEEQHGCE